MKFTEIIIDTPFWTNILIYMFLVKIRIKKEDIRWRLLQFPKTVFCSLNF